LVPKSVTLNGRVVTLEVIYGLSIGTKIGDFEWRNGHYLALFCWIR